MEVMQNIVAIVGLQNGHAPLAPCNVLGGGLCKDYDGPKQDKGRDQGPHKPRWDMHGQGKPHWVEGKAHQAEGVHKAHRIEVFCENYDDECPIVAPPKQYVIGQTLTKQDLVEVRMTY